MSVHLIALNSNKIIYFFIFAAGLKLRKNHDIAFNVEELFASKIRVEK
jgi:hypothetical protein